MPGARVDTIGEAEADMAAPRSPIEALPELADTKITGCGPRKPSVVGDQLHSFDLVLAGPLVRRHPCLRHLWEEVSGEPLACLIPLL